MLCFRGSPGWKWSSLCALQREPVCFGGGLPGVPCVLVLCCRVSSVRLCEGYLRLIRQPSVHALFRPSEDGSLRRIHFSSRLREWRQSTYIVVCSSTRRILHCALCIARRCLQRQSTQPCEGRGGHAVSGVRSDGKGGRMVFGVLDHIWQNYSLPIR